MNALQFSFLGYAMRLVHPEYALGLVAALLIAGLGIAAAFHRSRVLSSLFHRQTLARVAPTASPGLHAVRHLVTASAVALFALALAQPQCGTHSELAKRYGIDLVIALDASRSMLAKDVKPSRIDRAKLELTELLDRLKGDRVGIVVFAGDAFTQCPLTSDYAAAKMFLGAVDTSAMPVQGTNLARALEESRDVLVNAERGAKARAIVLLTDGEHTADSDVQKQMGELEALGIQVFSVGIGSPSGEPIPEVDKRGNFVGYKKDRQGNTVVSRLDERLLQEIADKTGGRYVRSMTGGVGVEEVSQEIDRLDKQEFVTRLTVKFDERFYVLAAPGLLLLLLGAAIRPGRGEART